jgi:hypothetical protein
MVAEPVNPLSAAMDTEMDGLAVPRVALVCAGDTESVKSVFGGVGIGGVEFEPPPQLLSVAAKSQTDTRHSFWYQAERARSR